MDNKILLETLCLCNAPSGKEDEIYPIIKDIFASFGEIKTGNLNNIYVHKKGKGKTKIMLIAHLDEVFLMITDICKEGLLKFEPKGIDPKTLVFQEVMIHGKKDIAGIIGIKSSYNPKKVSVEDLFIDTGLSNNELKKYVNVGDCVTIKRKFYNLLNNNVSCKAIDNRASIMAMKVCADELKNVKHDSQVYFVCSAQEEVGHRGAKSASYDINPDICIAIDVTFDNGRFGDSSLENEIGGGPVICVGPNIHPNVRKKIIEISREYNIPYQIEVEPGSTGTDAWDVQISGRGIPSLLISIPVKYMHTSVELINMDDIKNTGRLISKFIEKLSDKELEELLCF